MRLGSASSTTRRLPERQTTSTFKRFVAEPAGIELAGARVLRQRGKEIELVVNGNADAVMERLRARSLESLSAESLSLEEIFVTTLHPGRAIA